MKKLFLLMLAMLAACASPVVRNDIRSAGFIDAAAREAATDSVKSRNPDIDMFLLEKGVRHAASLWRSEDGSPDEFVAFVKGNYITDKSVRKAVFSKISFYIESLNGNFNEITLDLKKVLDLAVGNIDEIDRMFGNYSVGSSPPGRFLLK